jgi:hypothetical protein
MKNKFQEVQTVCITSVFYFHTFFTFLSQLNLRSSFRRCGAGAPELRKNGRPKRKSKSRSPISPGQGPAAVDAG